MYIAVKITQEKIGMVVLINLVHNNIYVERGKYVMVINAFENTSVITNYLWN